MSADLTVEAGLFAAGSRCVVGMDEVGRGALAGPVAVGAAAVTPETVLTVAGLTDSKLLGAARRERMVPQIQAWIPTAVGLAQPEEIDRLGITGALRLAGRRALAELAARGLSEPVDTVLLDGSHDWLSMPEPDLLTGLDAGLGAGPEGEPGAGLGLGSGLGADSGLGAGTAASCASEDSPAEEWRGSVTSRVKADQSCASVAAASVVAKVLRDELMRALDAEHPQYGWAGNKGYGAAGHRQAIAEHGPTAWHRLSWKLPADAAALRRAWRAREAQSG